MISSGLVPLPPSGLLVTALMVGVDCANIKYSHDGARGKSKENLTDYRTTFTSPLFNADQGKRHEFSKQCPRGDLNPRPLDTDSGVSLS